MRRITISLLGAGVLLLFVGPAPAHEVDLAGPHTHKEITTTVKKIQSGLMFFDPAKGLRPRAISVKKAERMGLHDAKPGDEVILTVDEANVLLDLHKQGIEPAGHVLVVGKLTFADPFWEVIEITSPTGTQSYLVDTLAGSKLNVLTEGQTVRVELDEANMAIDIHPFH